MELSTNDPWTGGEGGVPDWAIDDPDLEAENPFRRVWPASLAEAMRCLSCGVDVAWRSYRDRRTGRFLCPRCGAERASHNARKSLRTAVGVRDSWICHRCRYPIDPALVWPHPLAAVADHYPIARDDGGPAILANLKIAHALCNGNTAAARDATWPDCPLGQQQLLQAIVRLPLDEQGHVRAQSQESTP